MLLLRRWPALADHAVLAHTVLEATPFLAQQPAPPQASAQDALHAC